MKKEILISALVGAIVGGSVAYGIISPKLKITDEKRIAEYYATENVVHVSPHSLRKKMERGEMPYTLIDLRSAEEYKKAHITGSINIPAYKDKDTSDYGAVDRIISEFEKLPKDKEVVVYCYSTPCMTGRKVGSILAEKGIYVKHLGIGWNEWKNDWISWNHEHEWYATFPWQYITYNSDKPGEMKALIVVPEESGKGCPADGLLGC